MTIDKKNIQSKMQTIGKIFFFLMVGGGLYLTYNKAVAWCEYRDFFALDSAIVKGNYLVDSQHILATGNIHKKMDLLKTDCKAIRNNLETHPYVKAAIVSKRYPNKLEILIKERTPIAYLNAGTLLLIDKEGIVLPIPTTRLSSQLPVVTLDPDSVYHFMTGEKLASEALFPITDLVINTYSMSRALFNTISEIRYNLQTGDLTIYNKDNGNPVYMGNRDFSKKMIILANFQKLLSGKKRLRDYKYIDLRWEKQIVVKEL
ncbi:MAG: FtsQ-type POTRA domain-containing protein [Candidatus Marinimicrobia bacterium]|nr:FtsQ-type POTRA domain-containing protein [Candidatus Neomarinimicrobiota bacterium]